MANSLPKGHPFCRSKCFSTFPIRGQRAISSGVPEIREGRRAIAASPVNIQSATQVPGVTPCVIKAPIPALTTRHRSRSSVFQFYKGIEEAEAQQGQSFAKGHTSTCYISGIRTSSGCNPPLERGVLVAFKLPTSTAIGPRKDGNRKPLTAEPEVFPHTNRKQEGATLKKRGN